MQLILILCTIRVHNIIVFPAATNIHKEYRMCINAQLNIATVHGFLVLNRHLLRTTETSCLGLLSFEEKKIYICENPGGLAVTESVEKRSCTLLPLFSTGSHLLPQRIQPALPFNMCKKKFKLFGLWINSGILNSKQDSRVLRQKANISLDLISTNHLTKLTDNYQPKATQRVTGTQPFVQLYNLWQLLCKSNKSNDIYLFCWWKCRH